MTTPRGGFGNFAGEEEDIFQFRELRLLKTSRDYCNYSDPIEGEVCPLSARKVIKIMLQRARE